MRAAEKRRKLIQKGTWGRDAQGSGELECSGTHSCLDEIEQGLVGPEAGHGLDQHSGDIHCYNCVVRR